jgi:hypothetical protein
MKGTAMAATVMTNVQTSETQMIRMVMPEIARLGPMRNSSYEIEKMNQLGDKLLYDDLE